MESIRFYKYHDKGGDVLLKKQHTHNRSIEILHVIKGNGAIVINDNIYPLADNCIYFIKPMILHHSAPENCEKYIRSAVNISYNYINDVAKITGFEDVLKSLCENACIVLEGADSVYIDKEFKNLNSDSKSDVSVALINILNRLSKAQKTNNAISGQINDIISYINQNLTDKILLEEISKKFHISKYYLCHIFKETAGMSVMSYVLNQRIAQAKNLMINSEKSISEIALLSGFSCYSYFSRVFKEAERISPREFRKRYNDGDCTLLK